MSDCDQARCRILHVFTLVGSDCSLCLYMQVQAALADIATSPWKVVKYMLNSKVMSALKVRLTKVPFCYVASLC